MMRETSNTTTNKRDIDVKELWGSPEKVRRGMARGKGGKGTDRLELTLKAAETCLKD